MIKIVPSILFLSSKNQSDENQTSRPGGIPTAVEIPRRVGASSIAIWTRG